MQDRQEVVTVRRPENLKWKIPLFGLYGALLLVWHWLRLPCIWQSVAGVICPGCGMSRAWQALLRLDMAGAVSFHPMFWSVPLLVLYILYDGQLFRNKWVNFGLLGLILGGFAVSYVVRLIVYPGGI